MSEGLVVVGVGGHGRELFDIALDSGLAPIGFLDDGQVASGRVLGGTDVPPKAAQTFLVGVGDPRVRRAIVRKLERLGLVSVGPVVHPTAWVAPSATLADGVVVGPGSVITADSVVGEHTHLHANVVVAHDCELEPYCTLTPRVALAGDVSVGTGSFLGIGSAVNRGVSIGPDVVVGAGAVVLHDVAEGTTVAGVPAKPLQR